MDKNTRTFVYVVGTITILGVGFLIVKNMLKKGKLPQLGDLSPTTPTTPTSYTPPTPTPTTPSEPSAPTMSASEIYDRKIDNAAEGLYNALHGVDWSGAGEDAFWAITRSLDEDEREDVADVYDDDWGDLCRDIEGDFSGSDETRALKKYGYPSGNYFTSNC
jgi:hypothetical protein